MNKEQITAEAFLEDSINFHTNSISYTNALKALSLKEQEVEAERKRIVEMLKEMIITRENYYTELHKSLETQNNYTLEMVILKIQGK